MTDIIKFRQARARRLRDMEHARHAAELQRIRERWIATPPDLREDLLISGLQDTAAHAAVGILLGAYDPPDIRQIRDELSQFLVWHDAGEAG